MSTTRWNRTDLLGKQVHWLLDFTFAGQTFRLSTAELDVYDSTSPGQWLHYRGDLTDAKLDQELDLFNESISSVSVPVEFLLPEALDLIAAGHDLSTATGELSQWLEGTDYTDRKTVLVGMASDPEYGDSTTSIRLSLEENIFDDLTTIPGPYNAVCSGTVDTQYLDKQDVGLAYPIIVGQPGKVATNISSSGWVTGSQGVWRVHTDSVHQLVLAGHPVQCAYVYLMVNALPSGLLQVFKVEQVRDLAGRIISVVDSAAGTAVFTLTPNTGVQAANGIDEGDVNALFKTVQTDATGIYVGWVDADDTSRALGGIERNGKLVRDAGDVLELVLGYSQMRVDYGRIAAIKPALSGFKIDVAIDAQVTPWEWLRANLLPILPISLVSGPKGLYFVHWNFSATEQDAIATLDADADPTIDFADRISTDRGQVKNQFTLDYALSVRTGKYTARAQLNAELPTPHAVAELFCYTGSVLLTATAGGAPGNGINVVVVAAHATAPFTFSVRDSADGRTVTIGLQNAVRTGAQIADRINRDSTLIQASATANASSINWVYSGPGALQSTFTGYSGIRANGGGGSLICAESVRRYKGRISKTGVVPEALQSLCIYDTPTAELVLGWRAAAFALATRTVEVLVQQAHWDWLERGNVVLLTKASLGLHRTVALLEAIEYGDDDMLAFRFRIIENPGRTRSAT